MRVYANSGEMNLTRFEFPDGQPHVRLETVTEFDEVTIEARIANGQELLEVALLGQTLIQLGKIVSLNIRYLLGARMDRAINWSQPFTLAVVARILNGCGFSHVRILDPHSVVALQLIRNSSPVLPASALSMAVRGVQDRVQFVAPDLGARKRVLDLTEPHIGSLPIIGCLKKRDPLTGRVLETKVLDKEVADAVMIVDDICDGGATFVGLAKALREAGAKRVYLFVTHGIFSKGLPLQSIDGVFCTDSYREKMPGATVIPIVMPR